jgi:hypothetical protein
MTCRDVRLMADAFLCGELVADTNVEIRRHLDSCARCRAEVDAKRRLKGAVRGAFMRAPELQPSPEFRERLREQLCQVSVHPVRRRALSWPRLAFAAGVVFAVCLAGVVLMTRPSAAVDALARDAIGDHQYCALTYRPGRASLPLEEAARRFDGDYRLLLNDPSDEIATPNGPARVIDRHSCAYGAHRFGHVIMQYRGRVVSLLMTADDRTAGSAEDAIPHVIGRPIGGLSVVAVSGTRHAILLVSDLDHADLEQLSRTISVPLARRLEAGLATDRMTFALAGIGGAIPVEPAVVRPPGTGFADVPGRN